MAVQMEKSINNVVGLEPAVLNTKKKYNGIIHMGEEIPNKFPNLAFWGWSEERKTI